MGVEETVNKLYGNGKSSEISRRKGINMEDIINKKYDDIEDEIRDVRALMNDYETDENDNTVEPETNIQKFYTGSIFMTGGTGFLGKVLTEKLLRTCDGISKIYLLVRPKKGKDMTTRIEEILDDALFKRLHKEKPNSRAKIVPIFGDVSLPRLGMSPEDRKLITSEVSIIFHGAATVRFDEKLKHAVGINVKGVKQICELANDCPSLRSLVHISTAFAHCNHKTIGEEIYEGPLHYEKLIQITDTHTDKELEKISTEMMERWKYPNTYCLTKAIAENCVKDLAGHLPVCIHRPAIVVATYKEPIKSWIDNLYGPTGALVGAGTGLLRVMRIDKNCRAEIVPVDCVVNSLLAAAYQTSKNHKAGITQEIPVYNYVASPTNSITWGGFTDLCNTYGPRFPTIRAIWYFCLFQVKSKFWFNFLTMFLHVWPAFFTDIVLSMTGRKLRMMKIYSKINKFSDVVSYFALQQWNFETKNMEELWESLTPTDRRLFFFDMRQLDWVTWSATHCLGLRIYLLKDDLSTLPKARKHWKRLYYIHTVVLCGFCLISARVVWSMWKSISDMIF